MPCLTPGPAGRAQGRNRHGEGLQGARKGRQAVCRRWSPFAALRVRLAGSLPDSFGAPMYRAACHVTWLRVPQTLLPHKGPTAQHRHPVPLHVRGTPPHARRWRGAWRTETRAVRDVVARGWVRGGWALVGARRGTTPKLSGREDSPGTEILPLRYAQGFGSCAQDDRRGWTVSVALDRKFTPMGAPLDGLRDVLSLA
jgi:hypothetical protein